MPITLNHTIVPSRDKEGSAKFFAHIFGLRYDGPVGHFAQVHVAGDLPKIASNNRLAGTDADNKAIVHGSLALSGSYTVDEDKKTFTFNIEASTYPNLQGVKQTRTIDLLTDDEFRNTNPAAARDGPAVAANIYRRAK